VTKIAVTSTSFSKTPELRAALEKKFGEVRFNETGHVLKRDELVAFLSGITGVIVGLEKFQDTELQQLPSLKVIAKYGVGLDNLDLNALKRHGVELGWIGGVNRRSVSELTLAFVLGLMRNVFSTSRMLTQGQWIKNGGVQLSGKTVGIAGCGHIGKDLCSILTPFGVRILVHDLVQMNDFCEKIKAKQVDKKTLLSESDVVTIHLPYDSSTHHWIGEKELSLMKPSAILVNTCRGNVVDEDALYSALKAGKILAAASDVFATEPHTEHPLFALPNFVGTPHIGGNAREAVLAMGMSAIEQLETALKRAGPPSM
jgi:D-3-phosphoglycerate dehydrogenase